jgi:hypothetical protein
LPICGNFVPFAGKLVLDYYQYHGINNEKKPFIGITMGDPAGIGPEIAVKVFNQLIPEE